MNAILYLANRLVRASSTIIEYPYPRRPVPPCELLVKEFAFKRKTTSDSQYLYRSLRFSTSDICVATTSPGLGGGCHSEYRHTPPTRLNRAPGLGASLMSGAYQLCNLPPMLRRTPNRCLMSQPARETRQLCRAHPECPLPIVTFTERYIDRRGMLEARFAADTSRQRPLSMNA